MAMIEVSTAVRVSAIVRTDDTGPEIVHPGEAVVELLAPNVDHEVAPVNAAHEPAWSLIPIQNYRFQSGFGERVASRKPGGTGPKDQCVHLLSGHGDLWLGIRSAMVVAS